MELPGRNEVPLRAPEGVAAALARPAPAIEPIELTAHPAGTTVQDWLHIAEECRAESVRVALERAQTRAGQLMDSDRVGIAVWDPTGRICDANPAFLAMLGYSPDDLLAGLHWDRLRPDAAGTDGKAWLPDEAGDAVEAAFLRKDGTRIWCLASGKVFRESDGEGVAFLLDITKRKQREDELAIHHDALQATANAVVITDRTGTIQWVNPAFSAITGYAAEEVIGRNPRLLRSGLMKPPFYEHLWKTILAGEVWRGELLNRRKDGTLYVEEMIVTPVVREGAITHFVAIKQDVSERRRTEAALRDSEKRFRDLFEQSLDAILIADAELRVIDANPASERLLGWPREEMIGQNGATFAVDPRAKDRFYQTLRDRGVVRDFEVTVRTREGSDVDIQLNAVPRWDETGGLLGYVAIARDVTERKRFEEELQHLAFHDWLTGLPNLALFRDRLEHAVSQADRSGSRLALMYLDLDHFKTINDGHGHNAGDQAIQQVSRRLLACFREEDTVARIGGDEFTVIVERLTGPGQLTHVLERVLAALRVPLLVDGQRMEVEASIGAALYQGTPDAAHANGRTAEDLIRRADAAMFQAKRRPGTRFHIFDPAVDQDGSALLRRQQELRRAIEEDQLITQYQPVVNMATGELWGVEVLARWHHPERGMIPPGEFIPLAEECGLIGPLGEWILRNACRDMAKWNAAGVAQNVRLLVNLSARQLEDRDLPARLKAVLDENGIPPARLDFEVTESMAVHHPGRVKALRALGASVSVDDFGTGYSSLRYLRDLEVDSLKIEIGFVQGMESDTKLAAIVRTIVKLGADLGLDVIAEGIETGRHLGMLQEMGCPLGQGFLFSRPVDALTFQEQLSQRRFVVEPAPLAPVPPGP
jgi:diguanylate cyclase (GGDEF)-like protein/PAS domain S-box-containing protein